MPIIVFYRNGQHEVFQSRDTRELLDFRRLQFTTLDGHETYVYPEDVRRVEYFPDDEWAKMAEEAKKKHDDQEEAAAAAAAKAKSEREAKVAAETLALLESKTLKGRVKRLFKRRP